MSRYQLDGTEVWFGTSDAPAPSGVVAEAAPEITVGVSSHAQEAVVSMRYRRIGGPWQRTMLRPSTATTEASYFNGKFPELPAGSRIEYEVYVRYGGTRPKPECQIGGTHSFQIERIREAGSASAGTPAASSTHAAEPGDGGEGAPGSPGTPTETDSTMRAAKLAGLSTEVANRLAAINPERTMLGDETVGSLVSAGIMQARDVSRLGLASLALEMTDEDETAADKVMKAFESRGVEKPEDLTRITVDEMSSVIEHAGAIPPAAAKVKSAALKRKVANAFPTETLLKARNDSMSSPGRSSSTASSTVALTPETLNRVLERNAMVDLMRLDLSHHSSELEKLDLSDLSEPEKKAFLRDVQARKGTLTVAGDAVVAEKLLAAGWILSADIAASTPSVLSETAGLTLGRAKNVHDRALHAVGRSSHGLFTLWDAMWGGLADTAVGNIRRAEVYKFFDGLDNLEALFGEQGTCQCKHCNSVLGPAAYFVDLMHFIQTHVIEKKFKGSEKHPLHLKTRRPDLWVLPLTCENTHTEIPQLRITSEIFENFIAKKHDLAITPDRSEIIASVYGRFLPSGRHSVVQPFQLPLEELEIYLSHFKLRRSDVMRLLDEPEDAQLRIELGMSAIHVVYTTRPDPSPLNIHNKLGLTLPADGVLPMHDLLQATQLPRAELSKVLETRFVGGEHPPVVLAEKTCAESVQHDIERVYGLTLGHLDRLHRFLRLKTRLPWSPTELDAFLASAGNSVLDSPTLSDVGRAVHLQRRFRASVKELCALAGDLPDFPVQYGQSDTPIDTLFNVPDLVRKDGRYPNLATRFVSGDSSDVGSERSMRLRAGLRLDEGELTALIEGLSSAFSSGSGGNTSLVVSRLFTRRLMQREPFPVPRFASIGTRRLLSMMPTTTGISFPITQHNLSILYRHAVLGRWLTLNPTDLLTLIRLTPGGDDYVTNLADCMRVVAFYDWWKSTPFSLEDLSMLLAPSEGIVQQVDELWEAIQAWLAEQGEVALADTFLTQIEGVTEELSRKIVAANKDKVFEHVDDSYRVLVSWRDDAALDLSALDGSEVAADAVRDLIRLYHSDARLPRALTEVLRIEIDLARVIVQAALLENRDLTPSAFLQSGPLPNDLRGTLDALIRLHRLGTVLRLTPGVLAFFARHQAAFGITTWSEQNQGALRRMAALQAVIKARFREQPAMALAECQRLLEDADALPQVAAALFDIEPILARDLANTLRLPDNAIDALFKLEAYAEMAGKLSVDATTLSAIASDEYDRASTAAAAVLAGFRTKYPTEDIWREKFGPFEERVLEKKRDALIDYLLRGPDAVFSDANAMYKYFLIDGEVDGCFQTSRVVAATSSLQLYLHRIRMNLEKEPQGGLHIEPSLITDEEWRWRKHYRVWEANRKIFLWPENYLDPTIRDDKTPLFEELESELLQQEITEQTVIDAYANYLRSLEELANLRYAGAYHHYLEDDGAGRDEDDESKKVTDVFYLFGATGGDVPTHYWREIRNLRLSQTDAQVSPQYGPWHKVETRIPTRPVSPVVYNGQLYVFWNEITTTAQNAVNEGKSRFIGYSHRYALKFTSLRLDGQWTPAESISLFGAAPTFQETASAIDDPLAELDELKKFDVLFDKFFPWFGMFKDPSLEQEIKQLIIDAGGVPIEDFDTVVRELLTPRFGTDAHTKAREGYTLTGFMWERPYLSLEPSYDQGPVIVINCAGFLIRGVVDLFDRRVLCAEHTLYQCSPTVRSKLLAYREKPEARHNVVRLYRREDRSEQSLKRSRFTNSRFDYPVAAALALNAREVLYKANDDKDFVFKRHWGNDPDQGWSLDDDAAEAIASIPNNAGVWAVTGTPCLFERQQGADVVIETENDMLLLQPHANSNDIYFLHRIGTTLVRKMANKLFADSVDGLLSIEFQLALEEPELNVRGGVLSGNWAIDMTSTTCNPIANESAYGVYYQEIFQHIPLLLAHHLNAQGKYEEAQRWYHYVFDPTSPEPPTNSNAPVTDRNWKYRQFREQEQDKLRGVLADTDALQKYREDPFNVHAIARLRVSAYQKAIVMRYIDNLLDWADELFTRFQMETVNEAMMLYVTAAEILGPRPAQLGECGELSDDTRTYDKLKDAIATDGEFLLEVERLVPLKPWLPVGSTGTVGSGKPMFSLGALLATPANMATRIGTEPATPERTVGGSLTAFDDVKVANGTASKGPKLALAMPATQERVQAFTDRQQFAFLGGSWKKQGGRTTSLTEGDRFCRAFVLQVVSAFCIPRNELFDDYWNRVEGSIQKIRTCQDITGRKRALSLFAPPIDPNLLARARALGIPLDDAVAAFEGMIMQYRFPYLIEKAKAFVGTVQSFGSALQSALERKDSEELVRLQTTQQQQILALTTKAKAWELESARANLEATERRKTAVENRQVHYGGLLESGLNEWEMAQSIATHTASVIKSGSATLAFISGGLGLLPNVGSPFAMKYGGDELHKFPAKVATAIDTLGDIASLVATSAALEAGHDRRREDWEFQRDQSEDELSQIEKQIEAAEIARALAEHAIKLHEKNIEHNEELLEYHEDKFSDLGFYTWLASQLQRTYREAYNMAYKMARYAEQAYRFEREDYTSELLSGQYWEAARAGLLAGNRLTLDLQYLEQRYIETDHPKRELTDHFFSLRQWDPKALIELRQKGACKFKVPELFFDLASPGDYRRRLRSVRVTIPAVAGPYVNVMATLSLDGSQMRYEPELSPGLQDAPRPRADSITTSSARNDAGAFELNFRGEKYVPFEGAGAVSEWSLSLPTPVRMFDYNTISDVVLHLDYTASFAGSYRDLVQGMTDDIVGSIQGRLASEGMVYAFSLREEFPAQRSRLVAGETVEVEITLDHLPFFLRPAVVKEASLAFTGMPEDAPSIGEVEFDSQSLGTPTEDEQIGGLSLALSSSGAVPWKHSIRVVGLPADTRVWLLFRFGTN